MVSGFLIQRLFFSGNFALHDMSGAWGMLHRTEPGIIVLCHVCGLLCLTLSA